MTTLQNISLTCPICEATVPSLDVVSTNSFGGKRTDFHERAAGTQPLPYLIHVCASCGFSGRKYDYGEESEFRQADKLFFKDYLRRITQGKDLSRLSSSEKYELSAQISEWQGMPLRTIADRYLHAAWCCVDEGDVEAERYFRIKAANAFAEMLNKPWVDDDELGGTNTRAVYYYLVGELWRRCGYISRATEWFNSVAVQVTDTAKEQWVIDAAVQQKTTPREWFG